MGDAQKIKNIRAQWLSPDEEGVREIDRLFHPAYRVSGAKHDPESLYLAPVFAAMTLEDWRYEPNKRSNLLFAITEHIPLSVLMHLSREELVGATPGYARTYNLIRKLMLFCTAHPLPDAFWDKLEKGDFTAPYMDFHERSLLVMLFQSKKNGRGFRFCDLPEKWKTCFTRDDLLRVTQEQDGESALQYACIHSHLDWIPKSVLREITADDWTRQWCGQWRLINTVFTDASCTQTLLDPAIWVGRTAELQKLWQNTDPALKKPHVIAAYVKTLGWLKAAELETRRIIRLD